MKKDITNDVVEGLKTARDIVDNIKEKFDIRIHNNRIYIVTGGDLQETQERADVTEFVLTNMVKIAKAKMEIINNKIWIEGKDNTDVILLGAKNLFGGKATIEMKDNRIWVIRR
jgi:hypothetical protein